MHLTHLSNITKDNDFVNKSVRLSQDFFLQDANFPHAPIAHVSKTILEKYILYN
jgi:hypothetical protein